jgi:hypothetical protein
MVVQPSRLRVSACFAVTPIASETLTPRGSGEPCEKCELSVLALVLLSWLSRFGVLACGRLLSTLEQAAQKVHPMSVEPRCTMKRVFCICCLAAAVAGCFAQPDLGERRVPNHYFRPSRTLFFLRPDFLFRPLAYSPRGYGYSYGYGYGSGYGYGYGYGGRAYFGYGRAGHSGWPLYRGLHDDSLDYPGYWGGRGGRWSRGLTGAWTTYVSSPVSGEIVRSNYSDLLFRVKPAQAFVFLDGKLIGRAHQFATERDRYTVLDGRHELRLEFPGYKTFQADLEVESNRTIRLDIELTALPRK